MLLKAIAVLVIIYVLIFGLYEDNDVNMEYRDV